MIPRTVLVAALAFTETLSGEVVARAIARGLTAEGLSTPDLCPIVLSPVRAPDSPARGKKTEDATTGKTGETTTGNSSPPSAAAPAVSSLLEELDFDARMRSSRAVVLAQGRLEERTLRGSAAFEIATRARQGGIPAYAVVGKNMLAAFDARIMDLQAIFEAGSARALVGAGRKLARIV